MQTQTAVADPEAVKHARLDDKHPGQSLCGAVTGTRAWAWRFVTCPACIKALND